jgi:hypothetical protein
MRAYPRGAKKNYWSGNEDSQEFFWARKIRNLSGKGRKC